MSGVPAQGVLEDRALQSEVMNFKKFLTSPFLNHHRAFFKNVDWPVYLFFYNQHSFSECSLWEECTGNMAKIPSKI